MLSMLSDWSRAQVHARYPANHNGLGKKERQSGISLVDPNLRRACSRKKPASKLMSSPDLSMQEPQWGIHNRWYKSALNRLSSSTSCCISISGRQYAYIYGWILSWPTGWISLFCRARSNLLCAANGSSPISSRIGCRHRLTQTYLNGFVCTCKCTPRYVTDNSLSTRFSGIAAQFT